MELDSYKGLWWQFLCTNAAKLTLSLFIFLKNIFLTIWGHFFIFLKKCVKKVPLRQKIYHSNKKDKSKNSNWQSLRNLVTKRLSVGILAKMSENWVVYFFVMTCYSENANFSYILTYLTLKIGSKLIFSYSIW